MPGRPRRAWAYPPQMRRIVLLVGLLLIVAGCSSNPEIYSASSSGDGLTLDLSMNACHGEYTPVVGVSADQASVKITDSRSRGFLCG